MAAFLPDTIVFDSYKFRAVTALDHAWTRLGDIFFQLALAWISGVWSLTMVIMVAATWSGTKRPWVSFKLRARAAVNRAWANVVA